MKINYAVLSGVCASAASLFGKLSGLPILQGYLIVFRLVFFALMIICNAGVWTLFVKALHKSESSLTATAVSAASNYTLSALIGYFIFGELTTIIWWSGMFLIICGILLILKDENNEEDTSIKER